MKNVNLTMKNKAKFNLYLCKKIVICIFYFLIYIFVEYKINLLLVYVKDNVYI